MKASELPSIYQVLLVHDPGTHREMRQMLLAAFAEVETFYNDDVRRASFERVDHSRPSSPAGSRGTREGAKGRFSRTLDQGKLCELTERKLAAQGRKGLHVIVTDGEITPPRDWRYIIWSRCSGGAVVSLAPIDPRYWHIEDPDRIARIKHRVRTACLLVVGQLLGLHRCDNEGCFLYSDVDSVLRLDEMVYLGGEHELPALANRGFPVLGEDPERTESIVSYARTGGE